MCISKCQNVCFQLDFLTLSVILLRSVVKQLSLLPGPTLCLTSPSESHQHGISHRFSGFPRFLLRENMRGKFGLLLSNVGGREGGWKATKELFTLLYAHINNLVNR